jgi:uncharacterized protein
MIRGIFKIVLIGILTLSFTACEKKQKEEDKEVKFTPKLPMPSGSQEIRDTKLNIVSLWYDAKHDPIPATKIGYTYSEELKDYEKAIQWYKYSDSMIPLGENSYFTCYAYQQLKQYDEAIKWCQNSIDLKWDKALFQLADIYNSLGQYGEAINFYKKSFEKVKDGMSANNLGYLYSMKINNYQEADKWYKEAIKLENYESYKNLSSLYHEKLNDDIKASAYAIALINTKYRKSSVLKVLKNEMKIPNETIKKGYELQLNSPDFPVKFKGDLDLE